MSEADLAPTLSNFDAIVARNVAAREAKGDAPDTQEAPDVDDRDTNPGGYEAPDDEQEDQDDEAPELDGEPDEDDAPREPAESQVDQALRAPLKALREALSTKTMTPQLLEAIGDIEWDIPAPGGGTTKVRTKDLPGGFMRNARFSREMDKAKEAQGRAANIIEIERVRTANWQRDPKQLREGLRMMGCEAALERMCWEWAYETHQFESASPQEKQRIQYIRQLNQQRAQERAQFLEMQRQVEQMRSQGQGPQTQETRQASDYINTNMDRVLGAALKNAGVDRINDGKRAEFVTQLESLLSYGYELPEAMEEAAANVADLFRERQVISRQQYQQEEQRKPKTASPQRAPVGKPAQRDAESGRYVQKSNGKRRQPTAAEFSRRFGV